MRKERVEAVHTIAEKLFIAEAAIDQAVAAVADLNSAMPAARHSAGLSAILGQDAMSSAADTLSQLVRARALLVETHGRLDDVKTNIGLRTFALGGGMLKPVGASHLSVVEDRAA